MAKYIISDIHGCIDEFREMVNKISLGSNDKLYILGDLVDRGPDSIGCIRYAKSLNANVILGNHEHKIIKWSEHKSYIPHNKQYYANLKDSDIDYLKSLPLSVKIAKHTYGIHAGIRNKNPIDKQTDDDLLTLRFTDINGKYISIKKIKKAGSVKLANAYFWTHFYNKPYNIVYGHQVHSTNSIKITPINRGIACYGIDTGVCFGGNLSCLVWDTKEVVQVKAKQVYVGHTNNLVKEI